MACALLAGCPWGTVSSDELEAAYPYAKGRLFSRGVLADVVHTLETRLGGSLVSTGINVSPDSAVFIIRDPKHPERLDTWLYNNGAFGAPVPVVTSAEDTQDTSEFPITGLAFDRVREMMQRALTELRIEAGHVESVVVSRRKDVAEFEIRVKGPRQRGGAQFSAKGEFIGAKVD